MKNKEEVFVVCKRGKDNATAGQHCSSNLAYKMSEDGSHSVIFRCVKCSYQWSTPIGGSVSL